MDATATALTLAGRDGRFVAAGDVSLGQVISGRNVTVDGRRAAANSLFIVQNLALAARSTDVAVAEVSIGGAGSVHAQQDVRLDTLAVAGTLEIQGGRDVRIGDGLSEVTGALRVEAGRDIETNLAAATFDQVSGGGMVSLRGGRLVAGSVLGGQVLADAGQVRIDTVRSQGDVYVTARSGEARVGQATAGDDVYVLATHGDAVLGSARGTGLGSDVVGLAFSGNPDTAGNGRVVQVDSSDLDARLGLGGGGVEGMVNRVDVRAGRDAVADLGGETAGSLQIQAARDASLTAPSARLDSVTAGRDIALTSLTGGFTAKGDLTAGGRILVRAAGDSEFERVTAGGDLDLEVAGYARLAQAQAADLRITANDLEADQVSGGGMVSLRGGRLVA
ncbi:hypothetical protein, partial [uncultured Phenylobacterium sp.]|uniref:hypothetical protein n=1 Tax=uncultured Phenylobacterium sp. TaxID=349273 RepID=UPI0025EF43B2